MQSLVLLNPKSILLFLLAHLEPKSTKDALADPSWYFAMQFEYDALIRNVVWTLIDLPANRTKIGCKWVFRVKEDSNGSANKSIKLGLLLRVFTF